MTDWNNPYVAWYQYHKEDYQAVKTRLAACRNIMLHGPVESATRLLRLSCLNAVLSIQTPRDRHETAFTAYCAGDVSLEKACGMTVYHTSKIEWLQDAFANFDYAEAVSRARNDGPNKALDYVVENHTGLSHTKAGFALAMAGVWEVACPDTRTRQELEIDSRIRSEGDYMEALDMIHDAVPISEPLFVKQWVLYDKFAEEHARHKPFFNEVFWGQKWRQ